ncbi:fasciclin domain-containing protein [Flavobacterium phragmitis]|uniref:Uncaracterized surface protein containing fasciclin (FAS1) repeats n=1 Tax=Flavobacterium phragmitis TaxID=739143 RepID=A0A1I1NN65_9FLAO|nr:fasciclin domain-containing protein [Flavobacterium phragmitis]SFC99079.1 Uncaracterized surface protein containing fasciclin (FAS1) repeats [Flavobacterium phragmitis]
MKNIYNKVKHIALSVFLVVAASSCDNEIEDIGGTQQNYNTAYGLIQANSNLTTFTKAIKLAGLESTLDTADNYTYFVPNDATFDAYLVANGYVNNLGYPDINLVPVEDLKQLVLSHVIKGVKKRVGKLTGVEADYLETGDYATMANALNSDLYLLSINVTNGVLKVNGSDKEAPGLDYYGTNGFVNVLSNVIELTPPAPVISTLSQVLASPGDVITITGQNFVKVKSVKFGSTAATFTAVSKTEIKATVPADFNSYALIVVETDFGVSAPSGIGLKYLLYEDSLKGWGWGWGGDITWESTEKVSRGTNAIKKVAEAWSGLFMHSDLALNTSDYQFVKMSIFPTESTKIMVTINSDTGDSAKGTTVTLVPGQWNNISIPISALHPELLTDGNFDSVFIQEFSGGTITPGSILYIDDLGFL